MEKALTIVTAKGGWPVKDAVQGGLGKAAKGLGHTQKLLFCLKDNRDEDEDTKEYWEDLNFSGSVKSGTE